MAPNRARPVSGGRPFGRLQVVVALGLLALAVALPEHRAAAQTPPPASLLDTIFQSLTPEERVGQVIMVNFVGDSASPDSAVASLVRDYKVGTVLITASNGNVVNRDDTAAQVADLTNTLQLRAAEGTGRTVNGEQVYLPLFVAVDNEGDLYPFSNITHNMTPLPSNMTVGATWSATEAEAVGAIAGKEMSLIGVNLLLGPVVDVLDNPRSGGNGDIGTRSFGGNPAWVGELGRAYVRGVHEGSAGRVATVAKHFPGHGGSDRSTDSEVATVNKSLDQLRRAELIPFAALAAQDDADPGGTVDAMMASHIHYPAFQGGIDPSSRPISLDAAGMALVTGLPEFADWRPDHVMVSDSLGVLAVKKVYDRMLKTFPSRTVAHDALMAGNDILALVEFSLERGWAQYQLPSIIDTIDYLREQYQSDGSVRARIDEAAKRVLALKLKLYPDPALARATVDPAMASAGTGGQREVTAEVARAALTLLHPSQEALRSGLGRGPESGQRILVVECFADCFPYRVVPEDAIAQSILRQYGPQGSALVQPSDVNTVGFGELRAWLNRTLPSDRDKAVTDMLVGTDWIVFALADYNPGSFPDSGAVKQFLDSAPLDLRSKKLVAIAYSSPYHLDATEVNKLTAYFGIYSKTDDAIDVSVQALFGDIQPQGASPVSVVGINYDLPSVVQPDPDRALPLVSGSGPAGAFRFQAGPVLDHNGHPVPNGTAVSFEFAQAGTESEVLNAFTADGVAVVDYTARRSGDYTVTARAASAESAPLAVTMEAAPGSEETAGGVVSNSGSGFPFLLALAIGLPVGFGLVAFAAAALVVRRTRRTPAPAPLPEAAAPQPPSSLRVDAGTRRVYVEGRELVPPLSSEQFRLLACLFENGGRVCSREDLITRVWPGAHVAGVSEEALDALVRRVRERLATASGGRRFIVTLRGQGFRLDL